MEPLSQINQESERLQELKRKIIPNLEQQLHELYRERDKIIVKQSKFNETVERQKYERELKKRRKMYQKMEEWVKQNKPYYYARIQNKLRKAEKKAEEMEKGSNWCGYKNDGREFQIAILYLQNTKIQAMTNVVRAYIKG